MQDNLYGREPLRREWFARGAVSQRLRSFGLRENAGVRLRSSILFISLPRLTNCLARSTTSENPPALSHLELPRRATPRELVSPSICLVRLRYLLTIGTGYPVEWLAPLCGVWDQ